MEGIDALGECDQKGCGLLLCESCAVTLVNEHDGNLEGLLDRLKGDEEEGVSDFEPMRISCIAKESS